MEVPLRTPPGFVVVEGCAPWETRGGIGVAVGKTHVPRFADDVAFLGGGLAVVLREAWDVVFRVEEGDKADLARRGELAAIVEGEVVDVCVFVFEAVGPYVCVEFVVEKGGIGYVGEGGEIAASDLTDVHGDGVCV